MKRIIWGKFGACGGQACIGIDYILTQKKFAPTLVKSQLYFTDFFYLIIYIVTFMTIIKRYKFVFLIIYRWNC